MFLVYSKLPWAGWNESLLSKGHIEASAQLMRQLNLPVRMGLKFSVSDSWDCPGSWCPVDFPYYSHHYIGPAWLPWAIAVSPQTTHVALLDCLMLKMAGTQVLQCLSSQGYLIPHLKDTWFTSRYLTRIFHFLEFYAVLDMPACSSGSLRTLSGNIHRHGFWS